MRALLLAAGLGLRLRPLTLVTPKPLLRVGGATLLERHLARLAAFGVRDLVINVHHLREQILHFVGRGEAWGLRVAFSEEPLLLNTGGGLAQALPLLGEQPFIVVSSDVWTDFDLAELPKTLPDACGHLVMVDNPVHNPDGDYCLAGDRLLPLGAGPPALTYSGIALLHPRFLDGRDWPRQFPLRDAFSAALREERLFGRKTAAAWTDVGTPERLAELQRQLDGGEHASRRDADCTGDRL